MKTRIQLQVVFVFFVSLSVTFGLGVESCVAADKIIDFKDIQEVCQKKCDQILVKNNNEIPQCYNGCNAFFDQVKAVIKAEKIPDEIRIWKGWIKLKY